MKAIAAILAAVIAGFALTACGGKDQATPVPAYPVKIEVVEGIKTVVNPAFPKEGVVRYALLDDLTIGGEAEGAASVLNRPLDLKVDAQGDMYVLDWGDVDIKVFSPEGRLVRTIGKKGQGPGEFDTPAQFVLTADGRIFLLSGRQHQIITLDGAGKYLSSFKVDGFCDRLGVDRHDRVYFSQMLFPETGGGEEFTLIQNRMALIKTDASGKVKVRLGEYPNGTMLRKIQKDMVTSQSSREAYLTSWLVSPDDRVYLGYNKDYRLDVYDADWQLLFRFGREFTAVRHPAYKPDGPHPEFYPAFSDWRKFFDDKGDLWLEQYVEESVKDKVYDVFSPDGIYLRQVRVPQTLFLVRGDLAYSIIRQEDEYLVVKRFRMVPDLAEKQQ
jgi:hypothetical protein